jgi:molybdate transport system regulatory protein
MATLSIRIDFGPGHRIGPGKVALLENIAAHGSIAAAGRSMGMSYRRAWLLVAELNRLFGEPLVLAQMGGRNGGGAALTPLGAEVVERYRRIEAAAATATVQELRAIARARIRSTS